MPTLTEIITDYATYLDHDFSGQELKMKTYTSATFEHCRFIGTDFTGTIFNRCTFINCDMTRSNISHVLMNSCHIERCTLYGVVTDYLRMYGCTIKGLSTGSVYTMTDIQFNDVFLENCTFSSLTMTGAHFKSSILKSINFNLVRMTSGVVDGEFSLWSDVTFRDSIVQAMRFRDAMLFSISLREASKASNVDIHSSCTTEDCTFITTRGKKCRACGNTKPDRDFYKLDICKSCAQAKGYSQKNTKEIGKKTRLPSFSVEFEVQDVQRDSVNDPVALVAHDWVVCSDASVQAEYKSPIYRDVVAFSHVLGIMDGCKEFVGDHCGTHIHVEMRHRDRLRNHYHEVFDELETHCRSHTKETIVFWGRYFNHYSGQGDPWSRYSWINTSSEAQPTVEFRLSKFTSANQFKHLLKFVRSLVRYLDEQLENRRSSEEYAMISKTVVQMYQNAVIMAKKEAQ